MKRRNFIKNIASASAVGLVPVGCSSEITPTEIPLSDRTKDDWDCLATGKKEIPLRKQEVTYDVVVIGAGMSGIPAAVASARNGAKTVLINDRPVIGGNASSEIRVTVNGVSHLKGTGLPERETGIIEEFLIENRAYNPQESYPIWDHILYDFVTREPNLTLMLNTHAVDAIMDKDKIIAAKCWQISTETEFIIKGKVFLDCSGDGLMAAKAGAMYRTGREGKEEFGEKYAPDQPDGWQMGGSIMLIGEDMGRPMPYTPPKFAIKYTPSEEDNKRRKITNYKDGYWWVELGSEFDIIKEREHNRHKLLGHLHGVWDYIKNSGDHPGAANYALKWVGSLPGRRESRRFIGEHILTEGDLLGYRHYEDAVAYGGWSLDEHNPGGIARPDLPPSFFHENFKEIYEVPFRCLYSKNISNLMFAGRNASLTHIALSSTRIQGTCALMGQAIGTAATFCVNKNMLPKEVGQKYIKELQEQLLRDDVFIPNRPANDPKDFAKTATIIFASSTKSGDVKLLTDGYSRDINGEIHHWQSEQLPAQLQMEWEKPVALSKFELKCDTNLQTQITMRKMPADKSHYRTEIPKELLKKLDLEVRVNGIWKKVGAKENNLTRLVKFHFDTEQITALRLTMHETYNHDTAKLFEVRCYS
ncbi:FAD-dependent oxidoreductase [Aquimarina agarilytica]|uniref:FAD-dependent oxidoreductase n=1 Tax=Aquimarina agarilytica TaxID=1087449 RepID=UPI0002884567|nr:FAD-dependent oxidoreductase [Aquimarina agarilytica]